MFEICIRRCSQRVEKYAVSWHWCHSKTLPLEAASRLGVHSLGVEVVPKIVSPVMTPLTNRVRPEILV